MYLSKIEVNPYHPVAANALHDQGYMHRQLQAAFESARSEYNVLYRLMNISEKPILYVQSDIVPNWNKLATRGFTLIDIRNTQEIVNNIQDNNIYRFEVKAYPSKKKATAIRSRDGHIREYLYDEEKQIEWIKKEAKKAGFELLEAYNKRSGTETVSRKTGDYKLKGTIYQGILRVTDKESFKQAYRKGIGPEKAYGFGLLLLGCA